MIDPTIPTTSGVEVEKPIETVHTNLVIPNTNPYTNLNYSIVDSCNNSNILSSLFSKNLTEYLSQQIKDKSCKFQVYQYHKIKEIPVETLREYFQEFGEIIACLDTFIVLKKDNTFVIISSTGSNNNATGIGITIIAENIEDIKLNFKLFEKYITGLTKTAHRYIYLDWYYNTMDGYKHISITDHLYDTFLPEAYPYLNINKLAEDYINTDEPILVLMGPPGTGKTRLIRYILHNICEKINSNVKVMITSDQHIIEEGNLFLHFIGSNEHVLVLEDIDYHLKSRRDGNTAMYNFLAISSGLAVGHQKDKKIILSTNLPNVTNIEPALLRPGRCFGVIETRELSHDESVILLDKLKIDTTLTSGKSTFSLADLYNINKKNVQQTTIQKKMGF